MDSGTTRTPHSATRHVETTVGILSYQELAPLLAERVGNTEVAIVNRTLPETSIHDFLLDLHRRICVDMTSDMAGHGGATVLINILLCYANSRLA